MLNTVLLTLSMATPLVLAAMAGYCSERSGVINIGLEGKMLMAACVSALVSISHGPVLGVLAAILAAIIMSLVHWLATQRFGIDHVISGMSLNAISAGATNFMFTRFSDPDRSGRIGTLPPLFYQVCAIAAPLALLVYVAKTRGGLWLVAAGSDPEKARLAGLQPDRIRLFALIATGLFSGLAGAYLVADTGVFTDNMTAGRGYIALAALILGGWRVGQTALACLAFGFLSSLNLLFQGTDLVGVALPSEFWTSLPYLATVIALAGFLGKQRTPAGLGKT